MECGNNFILIVTSGESTMDTNIPAFLQDFDGDGNEPGAYPNMGTDYLDDVALWANTTDIRPVDIDGFGDRQIDLGRQHEIPPARFFYAGRTGHTDELAAEHRQGGVGGLLEGPPMIDAWITVGDGTTEQDFSTCPIPADFFAEGSGAYDGVLAFMGNANAFRDDPAPLFLPAPFSVSETVTGLILLPSI